MSRYNTNKNSKRPVNWSRKAQGAVAGFACGTVLGAAGTVLHTRRLAATPQGLSAALFMGTILAVGGAIRTN